MQIDLFINSFGFLYKNVPPIEIFTHTIQLEAMVLFMHERSYLGFSKILFSQVNVANLPILPDWP